MIDYSQPLEHFAFPLRTDSARHERDGTPDERATEFEVVAVGIMPIDATGYPHVLALVSGEGARDLVFANHEGRIAGRQGEYVANRRDVGTDTPPATEAQSGEGGRYAAPLAQPNDREYGLVERPKGK